MEDKDLTLDGDLTARGLVRDPAELGDQPREFQFVAENANDAIVIVSLAGDLVYANRLASQLTGYANHELIGNSFLNLVHPQEIPRITSIRAARHAGQEAASRYETIIQTKDGRPFPSELTVAPVNWRGLPAELAIVRDITERRRAEQELRRRDAILEATNFAAARFVHCSSWTTAIDEMLERLGKATGVERTFVFQLTTSPEGLVQGAPVKMWRSPDAPLAVDTGGPNGYPLSGFGLDAWIARLFRGQAIQVRPSDLTKPAREVLERNSVRTMLIVPILVDGVLWGLLGLSACVDGRSFSDLEVDTIRAAASILGAVISREKMERALQSSEVKYRGLVEGSNQSIMVLDRKGVFCFANNAAARKLGYSPEGIAGKSLWDVFPRPYADDHFGVLGSAFDAQQLIVVERETVVRGRTRYGEVRVQPLMGPEGGWDTALVMISDITDRKAAEAQILSYQERLRWVTSELALAEQRERRRISTELHDRIGQALALSKMKLGVLQGACATPQGAKALEEVRQILDQTIRDTRSLTFELSPPVLYELGLEPALEWLAERFQAQYAVPTSMHHDGRITPLAEDLRLLLFQIVQELLLNVAKHARARQASLTASRSGNEIMIEVRDDGVGFDQTMISPPDGRTSGFGLFSIRERLRHLGGQILIESAPNQGTQITLRAPLHPAGGQVADHESSSPRGPTGS